MTNSPVTGAVLGAGHILLASAAKSVKEFTQYYNNNTVIDDITSIKVTWPVLWWHDQYYGGIRTYHNTVVVFSWVGGARYRLGWWAESGWWPSPHWLAWSSWSQTPASPSVWGTPSWTPRREQASHSLGQPGSEILCFLNCNSASYNTTIAKAWSILNSSKRSSEGFHSNSYHKLLALSPQ